MNFSFDKDALIKEVAIAQEIITTKQPVSILSNILLTAEQNTLTIKASDASLNFTTKIPVSVKEEGTTTIYCDKFMSILSASPSGKIEFLQEDSKVTIKPLNKKIKFQLKSMTSDKFPLIKNASETPFFEVPAKDFKEMIYQTNFAVSEDSTRFFLMGVYLLKEDNNLVMVSTDGRRLSFIQKEITTSVPDFTPAIVPVKILNCILKNASDEGNISISVVEKQIFVKFGNYEFSSSLLEGQFPNYKKVIPENQEFSFSVKKEDLDSALKRTSILVEKKVNRLWFKVEKEMLTIICPETELGTAEEKISCVYNGNEITFAFNYTYVFEALRAIKSDEIVFEFSDTTKAVTMKPNPQEDYFHIVMPMSIN